MNVSKINVESFIKNKNNNFHNIILNTLNSIQNKRALEIISQTDHKLCTNELIKLKKSINGITTLEDLQEMNNSLSCIFKQYGAYNLTDLLQICYGNDSNRKHSCDKFNLLLKHFTPTGYKIVYKGSDQNKSKNDLEYQSIIKSNHLDCFDIQQTNIFTLKILGGEIVLHDTNNSKIIIISGIFDNIPAHCIENLFIKEKLDNFTKHPLHNNSQTQRLFYHSLSIKEVLINDVDSLYSIYNTYLHKANTLNKSPIMKVIKEYLLTDTYNQRKITVALLLDFENPNSQYLAYLLYDMLSEDTQQTDSKKQTTLYDSLPHELKQTFKNSIKNTLTYIDQISHFDESKIPMEQQICLLKTTNAVKEKAMQKLKEIKSRSEDSGAKSRQYLDGLIKIPFGIYKENKLINCNTETKKLYNSLYTHINNNGLQSQNILFSEIIKQTKSIKNKLNDELSQEQLTQVFKKTKDLSYIKEYLKNNNLISNNKIGKQQIINMIINSKEIKTFIYNNVKTIYTKEKTMIDEIETKTNYMQKEIQEVTKNLDQCIFGHTTAKRQLERIIGQWINGKNTGYCLGFEGPPGIGKTSLAKKGISNCLHDENGEPRPFAFIALGGSSNASTIDGHNFTYVGSTWGKIVDILMETKCMNPIIFIDELDKVSKSEQGKEIIGVLTHLTDYSQNDSFQDKYFSGINLDLSKILFIFSYNDPNNIDRILLDRIHRIKFDSIDIDDKLIIVKDYILPDLYEKIGVTNKIEFDDDTIIFIVENYTYEPGVRKLKEILFEIIGEINLISLKNEENLDFPIKITIENVKEKYLKHHIQINKHVIHEEPKIGMINGLWANSLSQGGILPIQACFFPASNNYELKLTGMQGDVMKESMNVARSVAYKLLYNYDNIDISDNSLSSKPIHIHCPDGATPKDGPSAGAAITLVIYSLLSKKKIKNNIAITGEINLVGDITEIGGLDVKIMGAYKANVKTIIYPKSNKKDFDLFISKHHYLNNAITFISVSHINDVFEIIFI